MKLTNKYKSQKSSEYFCELTSELDKLADLVVDEDHWWSHYLLIDNFCIENKCLAIRIPGGTVGNIYIDKNDVITKITIDTNYIVKTYHDDVVEQINKFVGVKIENLRKD